MKHFLPALLCLLLLLAACGKDATTNNRQMAYSQTYCADPWDRSSLGTPDAQTERKVRDYLQARGIPAADVRVREDGRAQACNACVCQTGKTIYVTANEAAAPALEAIGFK